MGGEEDVVAPVGGGGGGVKGGRDGILPQQIPDQMVLADVGGEVIDSWLGLLG